jgi:7-cyano-7-deazaguanine synthase in queuosine biosynthesis
MSDPARQRLLTAQQNYAENVAAIEAVLRRERGHVFEVPYGEDVVALFSGGLDSTVMIDLVIEEWKCRVHPLYIRRGARAEPYEEAAFDRYCALFRDRLGDRLAEPIKLEQEVPPQALKPYFPAERLQVVGHPMRNAVLQSLAVMTAVALNGRDGRSIRTVFSGSVAEDTTSPELGLLSLRVQTLSTCIHLGEWTWQVTSPMIETAARPRPLDDRDLIRHAVRRGIPLEYTRSCFGPAPQADGTCGACVKRRRAFEVAGVPDPAEYASPPRH